MDEKGKLLTLTEIRSRLSTVRGPEYWRSLEELAESEEFKRILDREFPWQDSVGAGSVSRREFLKLMGASLALAGLGACTREPDEKIVPYVRAPEEIIPGKPRYFATGFPLEGFITGVLVESHEGRPTKIEGNPDHPASLGATDAFAQASVLGLYDPDRSQVVTHGGRISTWEAFFADAGAELEAQGIKGGSGLRILTETVTSPTLADQMDSLLEKLPQAKWHQYEPFGSDNLRAGARLAFGEDVHTYYRFDRADVIVSLDADFLFQGPGRVRYARDFTDRRRVRRDRTRMNRLYVMESAPSLTGAMADHRRRLRAREIEPFARELARKVGVPLESSAPVVPDSWVDALARDLNQHRGRSVVVAGDGQPPVVHALAHAINHRLGNIGRSVMHTTPVEANPVDQNGSLQELGADIERGLVDMLLIVGGNPAFNAPADLRFAEKLEKVKLRIHLSLYYDETSALCHWHLPEAHYLESWSDGRAYDGTATILQPLIAPLYDGKSAHEILAALSGRPGLSGYEIAREYWSGQWSSGDFESFWRKALHDGFIEGSAAPPKPVKLREVSGFTPGVSDPRRDTGSDLEVVFRPDPAIWDGRFANNGWLQELPKPLTKLTWDNAAMMSPVTAGGLGLRNGEVAEFHYRGRNVRAPVWIMPGHADNSVTLPAGYGRSMAGKVGTGQGFDGYAIRTSGSPWFDVGLQVRKTGERYTFASTQHHHSMEGRELVRVGTIAQFIEQPDFVHKKAHDPEPGLTLYPEHRYDGNAWGMVIDLNACTGCNACVVACQAENNIPIVGKSEVARGREMQWIRIDRYYGGDIESPETFHQPVLCMHCENAPCEPVCPVGATVHSSEGLNEMIYNRCVGTRYCSNNCPYKVRRFNYFKYADFETPSLKLLRNPDVTVRSRGVMEKCTYCVQRINAARIEAKKENREIRDGEVLTACQQACPAEAIVFGNINDKESRVSKLKAEPLNYGLLTELNTRPRTTYLARLKNPNPEIEE